MGARAEFAQNGVGLMKAPIKTPTRLRDGVWQVLLQHAYILVDEIAAHGISHPRR